jgi:hypothetical protein
VAKVSALHRGIESVKDGGDSYRGGRSGPGALRPPLLTFDAWGVGRRGRRVNPDIAAPAAYPGWFLAVVGPISLIAGDSPGVGPGALMVVVPVVISALNSPEFSGRIAPKGAEAFRLLRRFGPVTSEPPKKNLKTLAAALVRVICPVGSELFTGSPTQYIYGFNPPRPNGLQLSGLWNRINRGL